MSDGTVVWTVSRDLPLIGGGALTGNKLTWNGADLGGAAIVAQASNYIKFASGLIIQWGSGFAGQWTSFPISFTTDCAVMAVHSGSDNTCNVIVNGVSADKSQVQLGSNVNGADVIYIAIGY